MGGRILEGITLTDAQKVQQKAIREKYAPQMMQLRKTAETTGTPVDEARTSELRTAQMAELRAILTAEQQVIFDRNVAEGKARRAERGK
jgi:Spy/CpxP family protein refolding chaperone